MQKEKRKAGVFGWLGILVFAMLVLQPLLILIGLRNTLLEAELDFPQLQERSTWYYFRTTIFFVALTRAAITTVADVMKNAADDQEVTLRGRITKKLKKEH